MCQFVPRLPAMSAASGPRFAERAASIDGLMLARTRAMPRRRLVTVAAAPLFVVASSPGAFATPPAVLEWTAPEDCPTRSEMLDQIVQTVGETTHVEGTVHASALVLKDAASAWRGEVELSALGQSTLRRVEGDSCRAVSDALALIVALAVNPDAEPLAPPLRPMAPPAEPASPAEPARRAELPLPDARRFAVGASLVFDAGMLPASAYGGAAIVGWTPPGMPRVSLRAVAAFLGAVDGTLATSPAQGGHFSLVYAGAQGCYALLDGAFELGPCGGVGGQWVIASGYGSSRPSNAIGESVVLSLGARAGLRLSSRFTLSVGAEGLVPFGRRPFVIDNGGTVFRAPVIALRSSASVEALF
jgi:hypothetical protein